MKEEGRTIFLSKGFLLACYKQIVGCVITSRIRTLGETLAPFIGQYAEKHNLYSDLSAVLNTLSIALKQQPLSNKEKAYALSVYRKLD